MPSVKRVSEQQTAETGPSWSGRQSCDGGPRALEAALRLDLGTRSVACLRGMTWSRLACQPAGLEALVPPGWVRIVGDWRGDIRSAEGAIRESLTIYSHNRPEFMIAEGALHAMLVWEAAFRFFEYSYGIDLQLHRRETANYTDSHG